MKRTRIVISCFNDSLDPTTLPVGFSWAEVLTSLYRKKYKVTILLHGDCIKFGLNSATYISKYGTTNPYENFLCELAEHKVKIVICDLCLQDDGFNPSELLTFVKPIPFSVDYIAQSQLKKRIVVYDAQLQNKN